jgi:hypothetical protein
MEKTQPGKLDIHIQETETGSLPLTLYQYQLKVDEDLDIRPKPLKQLWEAVGNTLLVGMQIGVTILESSVEIPHKAKDRTAI